MNSIDHFLREHAFVHRQTVAPGPFNMDYLVDGLADSELRTRRHGMNSIAWILWHIARVEDGFVSCIVLGRDQVFDQEKWQERLAVPIRDVSTPKDGVAGLSEAIALDALWEYRDAVGRRTREGVRSLWPDKWDSPIEVTDVRRAVAASICPETFEQFLEGKSRESALYWWGLHHTLMHLGQVAMLRGVQFS